MCKAEPLWQDGSCVQARTSIREKSLETDGL